MNRNEPQFPPVAEAECPAWLDEPAKAMWQELYPMLSVARVIKRTDVNAFARYCHTWSRWRQAEDFLRQYGLTYMIKDKKDRIKCIMPYPQVAIANKAALLLGKLEQELALTPSARTRVVISPEPLPAMNPERMAFFNPPRVVEQAGSAPVPSGSRGKKRQASMSPAERDAEARAKHRFYADGYRDQRVIYQPPNHGGAPGS